jgi:hypothetical protein
MEIVVPGGFWQLQAVGRQFLARSADSGVFMTNR